MIPNIASLRLINRENISDLEKDVEQNRSSMPLERLTCSHKIIYFENEKFEFLIGHKAIIIDWCQNYLTEPKNLSVVPYHPSISKILCELIVLSAVSNEHKNASNHRYSEKLMDFSIYLYIMAGRACYETLSSNLPLPKAGTICK